MEKRVSQKMEDYISAFKESMLEKIKESTMDDSEKEMFVSHISMYDKLMIDKTDFAKRKRSQNVVPTFLRCLSKRSDGEQCSRRKKEGSDFCGTHTKGSPHGTFVQSSTNMTKVEVWAQEICGIIYYIDNAKNVYKTEDIINNKTNPAIIAKYENVGDVYSIKDFGI